MSAAPAFLPKRARNSNAPVPIPAVAGGWAPVPRRLLERFGPALSRVERAVVDLVLLRTIADEDRGRPEWASITEHEFAAFAGATVDGVHRAITRLEHRLKILESAPAGRGNKPSPGVKFGVEADA